MRVILFCFPDATGQIGSRFSQAWFVPSSDGLVSGLQQFVDVPRQPWLLVSSGGDALHVGHIIDAFGNVGGHCVCVLLNVYFVVVCSCFFKHFPVS